MSIKYVHTNIIAKDWQRLAAFYEEVFGCEPVPPKRDQSGSWLERGTGVANAHLRGMHLRMPGWGENGPTLEIFQYDVVQEKPSPSLANRQGFGHIAFLVDNVSEICKKIIAHEGSNLGEISETDIPGVGHLTFAYMTDPEGNILEIQNWS